MVMADVILFMANVVAQSVKIGDFRDLGILPQCFQTVELPRLGLEDMHQDIAIVDGNPQPVVHSDGALVSLADVLLHAFHQSVGDAIDLGRRGTFTHHEILECRLFKLAHVNHLDIVRLAVLKSCDD